MHHMSGQGSGSCPTRLTSLFCWYGALLSKFRQVKVSALIHVRLSSGCSRCRKWVLTCWHVMSVQSPALPVCTWYLRFVDPSTAPYYTPTGSLRLGTWATGPKCAGMQDLTVMYEDFEPVDLSIPYQVRTCP